MARYKKISGLYGVRHTIHVVSPKVITITIIIVVIMRCCCNGLPRVHRKYNVITCRNVRCPVVLFKPFIRSNNNVIRFRVQIIKNAFDRPANSRDPHGLGRLKLKPGPVVFVLCKGTPAGSFWYRYHC